MLQIYSHDREDFTSDSMYKCLARQLCRPQISSRLFHTMQDSFSPPHEKLSGILGLQPRDKAAMSGVNTKEFFLEEFK